MSSLKVIVQLIDDEGQVHQNDTTIDLSEFKDPELVNEEERLHAFNSTFGFLMRSARHFVKYWAKGSESVAYFKRIEQYARDRGLSDADAMALMAASINSEEGTRHLQLPIQMLEPKEGEDYPRPKFLTRYKRGPVI